MELDFAKQHPEIATLKSSEVFVESIKVWIKFNGVKIITVGKIIPKKSLDEFTRKIMAEHNAYEAEPITIRK
jgi:hypothetical protein